MPANTLRPTRCEQLVCLLLVFGFVIGIAVLAARCFDQPNVGERIATNLKGQ